MKMPALHLNPCKRIWKSKANYITIRLIKMPFRLIRDHLMQRPIWRKLLFDTSKMQVLKFTAGSNGDNWCIGGYGI